MIEYIFLQSQHLVMTSENEFFALSGTLSDKSDWQLLSEHLGNIGSIAAHRAEYFQSADLAQL